MAREYDHLFKLLIIGDSGKLHNDYLKCVYVCRPRIYSVECHDRQKVVKMKSGQDLSVVFSMIMM